MNLNSIVDTLKDKSAECKAIVRYASQIHGTILKATSHKESPTREKHVESIHVACSSSPLLLSLCVSQLTRRLRNTQKWAVALKCLILIHRLIREGNYNLHDHVSTDSLATCRSYQNLDGFKDTSTTLTGQLSSWVRCYAKYIDQCLSTCRVLGDFVDERSRDRITSGLTNAELLKDIAALGDLLAVTCECLQGAPENGKKPVVLEALRLVLIDTWQLREEVLVRLEDLDRRILGIPPEEAVEFLSAVKRVGVQEHGFKTVMTESPQPGSLNAWEFAHVTGRLEECLLNVKERLRAVSGIRSFEKSRSLVNSENLGQLELV